MNQPAVMTRNPVECSRAREAANLYLRLGPQRSLAEVGRQLGKSTTMMERWSTRYDWAARAAAYDADMASIEREATENAVRSKSVEWLDRQQKLREREWEMHEKCIAAAERGLKTFMERDKAFTSLADIARILEVASKLGRMASGLVTDSVEHATEVNVNFRAEVAAAVRKVYGEPVEVEVVADRPRLPIAGS